MERLTRARLWACAAVVAGVMLVPLARAESLLDRSVVEGPLAPRDYWLFEAGPVRPLALSHDGTRLYATNIPDGALEVFAVHAFGLNHLGSVPVGLEPVALAVSPDDSEVWVVNHLSDSVSIVDVAAAVPHVSETLLVGDEPRDIVFAGPGHSRAFITTAHRGQNSPVNPLPRTPGIGRADVWVFDRANRGGGLGGTPLAVLTLFGDSPRALAATPDGSRVYAAVFRSGNRTTTLPPAAIDGIAKPPPNTSADGVTEPTTGLIVKYSNGAWRDELDRGYNGITNISLPDLDVFEIDANAETPTQVRAIASVGTTLFNMAVHPLSGDVYVSNTDARNHVRFAGEAQRADTTVRGHLVDQRISILSGNAVQHRLLNKHLDFNSPPGAGDVAASVSMPMELVFSADGETLYLAAFGSSKVAVYSSDELADDSFVPDVGNDIPVSGGGPAGLALDEAHGRLYVLTRFDNAIAIIDLASGAETGSVSLYNPEPESVTRGRKFLYDARLTSGYGNASCGSCHLFGDNDALAWDLGDPDGSVQPIPNAYSPVTAFDPRLGFTFHPMKGPMTTQSMRGLPRHGPQHWRGDRTGQQATGGETLEEAAFKEFNEAFDALGALGSELDEADMQAFTDFAMQLTYPPNPHRALDNSLTESEQLGLSLFNNGVQRANGILEICVNCHTTNPAAGIFGTSGTMAFNDQPGEKDFKIPHFRDQYQKVGMFTSFGFIKRDEVRGFGLNHNGATSTNATFSEFGVSATQTNALKDYLYAFPAESAPVMGQQLTLDAASFDAREERFELLLQRAAVSQPVPECDLVANGVDAGRIRGWWYDRASAQFIADASGGASLDAAQFEALVRAASTPFTLSCLPWGSGERVGVDRDRDGVPDSDEVANGSDPAAADSIELRAGNGLWVSPALPGSGFDLHYAGDILVLNWITFDEDSNPTWYQAVALSGQQWAANLLRLRWLPGQGQATYDVVGEVSIDFSDRHHGVFDWTIGEQQGQFEIERFLFSPDPTALPLSGIWVDPDDASFGLTVETQGDVRAILALFFDQANDPRWALAVQDNAVASAATPISVTGPCPWCADEPVVEVSGGSLSVSLGGTHQGEAHMDVSLHSLDGEQWLRENTPLLRVFENTDPVPDF